jgi:phage N-6-adenine-methyltransferase
VTENHNHFDSHDAGKEWGTPPEYWRSLAVAIGGFDLDPASGAETEPIADTRWTIEDDGLPRDWFGDVWVNPPYSRELNPVWAEKIADEAERDAVDSLTALVPGSTDTQWFQNNYAEADLLTFIEGRVSFDGAGDNSASFPSVVATWGDVTPGYMASLRDMGFVTRRI